MSKIGSCEARGVFCLLSASRNRPYMSNIQPLLSQLTLPNATLEISSDFEACGFLYLPNPDALQPKSNPYQSVRANATRGGNSAVQPGAKRCFYQSEHSKPSRGSQSPPESLVLLTRLFPGSLPACGFFVLKLLSRTSTVRLGLSGICKCLRVTAFGFECGNRSSAPNPE